MVYNWLKNARTLFFESDCLVCGSHQGGELGLCPACQRDLPRIRHACPRCAFPLTEHTQLPCGGCLQHPPQFDRAFVPFHYAPPFSSFVPGLKFNSQLAYARLMGHLYQRYLLAHDFSLAEAILPVPLHASRLRQRGFNQALEIARPLARALKLPLLKKEVRRIKNTAAQSGLKKARRQQNIRDAFAVVKPINYQHIAILDDVITTGNTANELAAVLKQGGVKQVDVWAIARA